MQNKSNFAVGKGLMAVELFYIEMENYGEQEIS